MSKRGFTHESTTSQSTDWYTPRDVYEALYTHREFDLDPCSPGHVVIPWSPCRVHITAEQDGLGTAWNPAHLVFLNPPYATRTNSLWLHKLAKHPAGGVALMMARTDTDWFHRAVRLFDAFLLTEGRIAFVRPGSRDGVPAKQDTGGAGSVLFAKGPHAVAKLAAWTVHNGGLFLRP